MNLYLLLHIIAAAYMTGVIWLVQLVHYPAFRYVREQDYTEFQEFHMNWISPVVVPGMMVELLTAGLLLWDGERRTPFLISGILLIIIWASTFLWQTPLHASLSKAYSPESIERLVRSNWLRTIAWSTRLVLLTFLVLKSGNQ